ncbi:hypothetical protein BRD01_09935 [Halobacteriales archaeon QS_8_65_32]|jgi:hypothetical protein|nr:MAG: hypothetical protein BRD01_09935 [Halobacteriales archaeon QS_8_65_32]
MDAVRRASIAGTAAVVAAVALLAVIGVEPVTALTTGTGLESVPAGLDAVALQIDLLGWLTRVLDRIADFLNQLNRVLSEFARLFGEGGGGEGRN